MNSTNNFFYRTDDDSIRERLNNQLNEASNTLCELQQELKNKKISLEKHQNAYHSFNEIVDKKPEANLKEAIKDLTAAINEQHQFIVSLDKQLLKLQLLNNTVAPKNNQYK